MRQILDKGNKKKRKTTKIKSILKRDYDKASSRNDRLEPLCVRAKLLTRGGSKDVGTGKEGGWSLHWTTCHAGKPGRSSSSSLPLGARRCCLYRRRRLNRYRHRRYRCCRRHYRWLAVVAAIVIVVTVAVRAWGRGGVRDRKRGSWAKATVKDGWMREELLMLQRRSWTLTQVPPGQQVVDLWGQRWHLG